MPVAYYFLVVLYNALLFTIMFFFISFFLIKLQLLAEKRLSRVQDCKLLSVALVI